MIIRDKREYFKGLLTVISKMTYHATKPVQWESGCKPIYQMMRTGKPAINGRNPIYQIWSNITSRRHHHYDFDLAC